MQEQVLFSLRLEQLEPIFKSWVREVISEKPQIPEEKEDEIIPIEEAAKFLHLSKPTLYSKVSRNELPCMKKGKRLYFSKQELTEYLKNGKRKTKKEIDEEVQALFNKKGGLKDGVL